jgi:hypothetical protein
MQYVSQINRSRSIAAGALTKSAFFVPEPKLCQNDVAPHQRKIIATDREFKGIVSPDWKGLHMFSLDRFDV